MTSARLDNFQWLTPITTQTGKAWVDIVNEPCGNCFRTSSLRWKATQINNNKSCYVPIRGLFQKKGKKKEKSGSECFFPCFPPEGVSNWMGLGEVALCVSPWFVGDVEAATVWHESRLGLSKRKVRKDMERTRSYRERQQLTLEKLPLRDSAEP